MVKLKYGIIAALILSMLAMPVLAEGNGTQITELKDLLGNPVDAVNSWPDEIKDNLILLTGSAVAVILIFVALTILIAVGQNKAAKSSQDADMGSGAVKKIVATVVLVLVAFTAITFIFWYVTR